MRAQDPAREDVLLARAVDGSLDASECAEWNRRLRREPALLERFLDHVEVEARLHGHFGGVSRAEEVQRENRGGASAAVAGTPRVSARRNRVPWGLVAAAALLLVVLTRLGGGPGNGAAREFGAWRVVAHGDADFEHPGPDLVRLRRGELHIESTRAEPGFLRIETPAGDALASGTSFLIGCHSDPNERNSMSNPWVRVLVLAGSVTLGNAVGGVRAEAGELVSARAGQEPERFAARITSEFGLDLLRTTGGPTESGPNSNVFFSPYSIAATLAMAAEGARGETAKEFERILHLPAAARRLGTDEQRIPLYFALLRSGFRDLEDRLARASSLDQSDLLERVTGVESELRRVALGLLAAELAQDYGRHDQLRGEEERLINRHRDLLGRMKTYRLEVARSLWGEQSYPFRADYLEAIEATYGPGSVVPANFRGASESERERVNAWVTERTEGRVTGFLGPGDVDELTRVILVNAVHFEGEWVEAFDPAKTETGPFHRGDGTTVEASFMRAEEMETARYGAFDSDGAPFDTPERYLWGEDPPTYPDIGGFTVLSVPYRGEDIDFVAILPRGRDGLSALEAKLTPDLLEGVFGQLEARTVDVALPRLDLQEEADLSAALGALGLERAFMIPSPGLAPGAAADFSGMSRPSAEGEGLFLSGVVHRAVLKVDERGTTAEAATAAVFAAGSEERWITFTPTFRADHPFLLMIRERSSGALLFLGRIQNPGG